MSHHPFNCYNWEKMRDVVGIQTAWLFMLCYSWNGKVSKATKTSTYDQSSLLYHRNRTWHSFLLEVRAPSQPKILGPYDIQLASVFFDPWGCNCTRNLWDNPPRKSQHITQLTVFCQLSWSARAACPRIPWGMQEEVVNATDSLCDKITGLNSHKT